MTASFRGPRRVIHQWGFDTYVAEDVRGVKARFAEFDDSPTFFVGVVPTSGDDEQGRQRVSSAVWAVNENAILSIMPTNKGVSLPELPPETAVFPGQLADQRALLRATGPELLGERRALGPSNPHDSVNCFVIGVNWLYSPAVLFESLDKSGWTLITDGVTIFYLIRPFVLWPLSPASVFLGYLVEFPSGVPLVLTGTLVTCLPPFLLADSFQNVNGYVSRISATGESIVTTTAELRGMVAARLSPTPADLVSIGAGSAGVSSWNFALRTFIGELPWAIFYVTIGQSLRSFSSYSVQTTNIGFLLIVSCVAGLLLAGPIYRFIFQTG